MVETTLPGQGMQKTGFDPWVGKIPEGRNGEPLQCSCLGNRMDFQLPEEPGRLQSVGSQRVKHGSGTEHTQKTENLGLARSR